MSSLAEKAELVCHFVIQLSGFHVQCTPVCFLWYDLSTQPLLWHDKPLKTKYGLKEGGNQIQKLFRNMHIFSQGIFFFFCGMGQLDFYPTLLSQVAWSSTNPSVGFQIRPSQVHSRCSDYRDSHNAGTVESRTQIWLPWTQECGFYAKFCISSHFGKNVWSMCDNYRIYSYSLTFN